MQGHGRPVGCILLVFVWLGAVSDATETPNVVLNEIPVQHAQQPWHEDADLADVCFVDAQHGWAVGDRGVIWHTADGGRTWHYQSSGVNGRLRSVHFIDALTGWTAGEITLPYSHLSVGLLLRTADGGQTWTRELATGLPGIECIRFRSSTHGWAVGRASAQFPSGIYLTQNGGSNWMPVSAKESHDWICGDVLPTGEAIAAGGALASMASNTVELVRGVDLGLRSVRAIRFAGPRTAWLVGDGGTVLFSTNAGRSWRSPTPLPQRIAEQFDFRAVDAHDQHCWIAGSPGTAVLHSADGGQTWEVFPTGQNVPLNALTFVSDRQGWAVGALGTVLATVDGGRTWHVQRSGGARAAVLAVYGEANDLQPEIFAHLGANEGYLSRAEVVGRRDLESASLRQSRLVDRACEAVITAGGSGLESAWQFPLRQGDLQLSADRIIEGWNWANTGSGLAPLEARLVRQIRIWRPDVVIAQDEATCSDPALGKIIQAAVIKAVAAAADAQQYPEQFASAGLSPWQVKRVYAELPPDAHASVNITSAQLVPGHGCSVGDLCGSAYGLLKEQYERGPQTSGFRLLMNQAGDGGTNGFFVGIDLAPGSDARRRAAEPNLDSIASLQARAQQRRHLEAILERSATDGQQSAQLLGQIGNLTRNLDAGAVGEVLYGMASQYHARGRSDLAAQTYEALALQHQDHPLSYAALLWLVQYHASSEAAYRSGGVSKNFAVRQASANWQLDARGRPVVDGAIEAASLQESQTVRTQIGTERTAWAQRWTEEVRRRNAALMIEPAIAFPLAATNRGQQNGRAAKIYAAVVRDPLSDAWRQCAEAETALASSGRSELSKLKWHCATAKEKPLLDGILDEALWSNVIPVELRSPQGDDASWPAAAMLAHDDEFLYLAITCRQAAGIEYKSGEGPRPRDVDLSGQDRVEVFFDIDRDWTTHYRMAVDHRGWTAESCWGDSTWNPAWYVAANTADGTWTIEAAIPLDGLTGEKLDRKRPWAVGIQRTVPGIGFQSWTTPANTAVMPEGFGLLMFE